jgi:hypothetical protein
MIMDIAGEFSGAELGDVRLSKRLDTLAKSFQTRPGGQISFSCDDWKSSKATYRFFDNDRFSEEDIIAPHIQNTFDRMKASEEKILIAHDSSEIIFPGKKVIEGEGFMGTFDHNVTGKECEIKGLMLHSSLAITSQTGIPLGLAAQKMWTRDVKNRRKIRNAGKNFSRVPVEEKESFKWIEGVNSVIANFPPEDLVHICDRDADMYELFFNCISFGTNFVIRAVHGRCISTGSKIFDRISRVTSCGSYDLHLPKTHKRDARIAKVKIRFYKVNVLPPIEKSRDYPPVELYVVSAKESSSKAEDRVDWKLVTNMPLSTFDEALEKINWYKMRWNVEVFFKTLKSGYGIEKSRLRHIDRLKKFTSFVSVLAWQIFWLSKVSREDPEASSSICFSKEQKNLIINIEQKSGREQLKFSSPLNEFIKAFARLGGYLARNSDPPPGQTVLWRAMSRLNDIQQGGEICG